MYLHCSPASLTVMYATQRSNHCEISLKSRPFCHKGNMYYGFMTALGEQPYWSDKTHKYGWHSYSQLVYYNKTILVFLQQTYSSSSHSSNPHKTSTAHLISLVCNGSTEGLKMSAGMMLSFCLHLSRLCLALLHEHVARRTSRTNELKNGGPPHFELPVLHHTFHFKLTKYAWY